MKPRQGRDSRMLSITLPGNFTHSQGKIQVFVERVWYRADQQKREHEITEQRHAAPGRPSRTVPCPCPEEGPVPFPPVADTRTACEVPACLPAPRPSPPPGLRGAWADGMPKDSTRGDRTGHSAKQDTSLCNLSGTHQLSQ